MLWTIGQFPELDHLEPAQRALVLGGIPWWTYPLIVGRGLYRAGIVAILLSVTLLLWRASLREHLLAEGIVMVPVAIASYLKDMVRIRGTMRRELIGRFRGQRPPFCMECGYDLRAMTEASCSECGKNAR